MTTFPAELGKRAAQMIAQTADLVKNAHQRINALGSQVASLTPGSWEDITLSSGWSNLAGYTPAIVRIPQSGSVQLSGHITGGTTTGGTVIGTVDAGFYNASFAHQFAANVLSGAASVSAAGTLSSTAGNLSSGSASLNDGTGVLNHIAGDLNNGTVSGSAFGSLHVATGLTLHQNGTTLNSTAVTLNSTALSLASGATSTPVNYNTCTITLNTSGQLVLSNCPASATQVSFNETLPLIGA